MAHAGSMFERTGTTLTGTIHLLKMARRVPPHVLGHARFTGLLKPCQMRWKHRVMARWEAGFLMPAVSVLVRPVDVEAKQQNVAGMRFC